MLHPSRFQTGRIHGPATRLVLAAGVLIVCLALGLQYKGAAPWQRIDTMSFDFLVRLAADSPAPH